jgi:hypothetical protein
LALLLGWRQMRLIFCIAASLRFSTLNFDARRASPEQDMLSTHATNSALAGQMEACPVKIEGIAHRNHKSDDAAVASRISKLGDDPRKHRLR